MLGLRASKVTSHALLIMFNTIVAIEIIAIDVLKDYSTPPS